MYSQYPQPQPYPPPQPEKKPNYWLIGCFGCGGALALIAGIIIIFLVVVNSGDDSGGSASDQPSSSAGTGDDAGSGQEQTAPADDEPVAIVAEPAEYEAGALSQGGDFVAVYVTVTNNSDEPLAVNPLYFSMEGSDGQSQDADLMESAGQEDNFEALDLANGESESGVIVFPGTSDPVSVTHTGVMGDAYTADVA
ncbi:DUF4352 domain-containing protein [Streptomonospora wellingtoniae]|uniref:DUF4352 domain-containing protein n=1 Tax=Streptomonospora wellingtoniae TaxID=3075544 RepID=A0ABU2KQ91_9ACTN|nr:DUF4352 domain-containing protein [Streptomonospora sp. DSM 45055]MDT0301441.1 DUF4352 domain-containing protein [Streptomonospora sp. DSM 45055]